MANGYSHNAEVIYGDTDSVMVKFGPEDVAKCMALGTRECVVVCALRLLLAQRSAKDSRRPTLCRTSSSSQSSWSSKRSAARPCACCHGREGAEAIERNRCTSPTC
jgi:hypothetical protein